MMISEIKKHIDSYGHYGIGLKKEWAISKKLNPVLYLETNSVLATEFIKSYRTIINLPNTGSIGEAQFGLIEVLRYSKNFEGLLKRYRKTPIKNYRFSDEREWRYVPPFSQALGLINASDYKRRKKKYNNEINHLRLEFVADDIKYIILKNESEINSLLQNISDFKGSRYSLETVERLKSRVITTDQIMKDF